MKRTTEFNYPELQEIIAEGVKHLFPDFQGKWATFQIVFKGGDNVSLLVTTEDGG